MSNSNRIEWVLRLVAAAILLQTLFFKFTGAEESKWIFSQLGAEPAGRLGSGVVELLAAVLLIVPSTVGWGALLAAGTMAGAIASHLFIFGIEVQGDGGLLFGLAVVVFICSGVLLWRHRGQIPVLKKF